MNFVTIKIVSIGKNTRINELSGNSFKNNLKFIVKFNLKINKKKNIKNKML